MCVYVCVSVVWDYLSKPGGTYEEVYVKLLMRVTLLGGAVVGGRGQERARV